MQAIVQHAYRCDAIHPGRLGHDLVEVETDAKWTRRARVDQVIGADATN